VLLKILKNDGKQKIEDKFEETLFDVIDQPKNMITKINKERRRSMNATPKTRYTSIYQIYNCSKSSQNILAL
jgi:hypothetical protein